MPLYTIFVCFVKGFGKDALEVFGQATRGEESIGY